MSQSSNRRRFHRFPFDAEAVLIVPDHARMSCDLVDLSISGALLSIGPEHGQVAGLVGQLDLHLRGLVRGDEVDIQSKVEAVWQEGQRLGCRLVSVDADSFAHLKALVEDNLGDPGLLDRELIQLAYWPGVDDSTPA